MKKIKIGFVGAGFMGQLAHLTNYANLDECEVVAIAEPRRELAEKVAQRYGIKEVFKDHLELLNKCEVDAIVAAQPYTHHIKLIPDILKAKKPLLTEKPLALSPEAGEELVRLAQGNNVLYMIGNHKRSDPAMEYAKKLVDEWKATGLYGKMKLIRITMPPGDWVGGANKPLTSNEPYPEIEHEAMPQYFDEVTGKLYNSFVNYYIHQVNAMHFFYGEPYDVTFADKSGVLLVTESKSGVCGTIEMAPFNTSIDWQESVLIAFEKGYIKVELPPPLASQLPGRVTVMKDNGNGIPTIEQPILPRISAMAQQARNFLAAVRGEKSAPCEAKDAVEDLKIARKYVEMFIKMQ